MEDRARHHGGRARHGARGIAVVFLALAAATPAAARQDPGDTIRSLTLADAVRLAEKTGEPVRIAEAGLLSARAGERRALAARLPQLSGSLAYTRTLASQFRGAFQQQDSSGSSGFGGTDFGKLGFGSLNTWNLGLSLSWHVFDGGALAAASRAADAGRTGAQIALASARAGLELDVTEAYYDAQLAQRMVDIAGSALAQAESTLRQTVEKQKEGTESEFEVLRARVDRDNRKPDLIRRRTARDVAFFRLKQLLDLPLDTPLALADSLDDFSPGDTLVRADGAAAVPAGPERAPVRQAKAALDAVDGQLDQARAQHFPGVSLTSSYGRVAYPTDPTPSWSQFRTNWTVGVALDLPIFVGGRIGSDEMSARAGREQAEARLRQVREQAALDTYQAQAQLTAARSEWAASEGTVAQAERAYRIAELRFREGLSTQLELSDARLLLEQARGNRAQAARDLHVAVTRVRLLPDLPLGTVTGSASAGASAPNAGTTATTTMQAGDTIR